MLRTILLALVSGLASGTSLSAQVLLQPVYPEGAAIPRNATPDELAWEATHGGGLPKGVFSSPSGPHVAPGEYAPCEGIIMAWEGSSTWNDIQRQMMRHITTTGGGKVYLTFDTTMERDSIMPTLTTNALSIGTVVSKVVPFVATTDSIWLRDYGPRYIYEGAAGREVRVISDHTYNRSTRVNDNAMPVPFAAFKHHAIYTLPLIHGGGNYHLNSLGVGYATQLITNENPSLSAATVQAMWLSHWGAATTITPAFPTSVDATQHIDMWVQIVGDNAVVVSDWPANTGSTQDVICDNQAAAFAAAGWTVTRVPARLIGTTHYTYTNVVMCNNIVLLPSYTNATMTQYNAPALAAWQAACPGKTIIQINCEAIVTAAGVMHCIVMHMPVHRGEAVSGGLAPTVWLRTPRGNADASVTTFTPGQQVSVKWISDDDVGVSNVDIEFSRDGGTTWAIVAGGGATADDGLFTWTAPNLFTTSGKLRVVARDADGRTGANAGDGLFTIAGTPCTADIGMQGGAIGPDGILDNNDFVAFINAFFDNILGTADIGIQGGVHGADGVLDNNDFVVFIDAFFGPC